MIAIALGAIVYVFDASKGDVHQLCDLTLDVTSLQWSKSGKYLTVGTSDAEIQVSLKFSVKLQELHVVMFLHYMGI